MAFLLIYTTHPDEKTARKIASQLVERSLVACANSFPIQSAFWWEGVVEQESEWVCLLKTRIELEEAVEKAIVELHPYDLPCIMRYEVRANEQYEDWIYASTEGAI